MRETLVYGRGLIFDVWKSSMVYVKILKHLGHIWSCSIWLVVYKFDSRQGLMWTMDSDDYWRLVQEGEDQLSLNVSTSWIMMFLCVFTLIETYGFDHYDYCLYFLHVYLSISMYLTSLMRCDMWIPHEDHLRWRKENLDLERCKEELDQKVKSTTFCLWEGA